MKTIRRAFAISLVGSAITGTTAAEVGGMTKEPGKGTSAGQDMVRGAAKGAIIGGIAGDAGKGAAAGAADSMLMGGIRCNR